jgi:ATP-dependent Lhr-like helicase
LPAFAPHPTLAEKIVTYMLDHGVLSEDQGLLWLGRQGEERFGHRHFLELFSIFVSEPLFAVRAGRTDIGYVHQTSFLGRQGGQQPVLVLAGRAWAVRQIDWNARVAYVEPTQEKGRSRWLGAGQPLSARLCEGMRNVQLGSEPEVQISKRATADLSQLREHYKGWLPSSGTILRDEGNGTLRWWTFAGLRANRTLAVALKELLPRADNVGLTFSGVAHTAISLAIEGVRKAEPERLLPEILDADLEGLKFSECLPQEIARRVAAGRAADPQGTAAALRGHPASAFVDHAPSR